jgi:hypothetical protein
MQKKTSYRPSLCRYLTEEGIKKLEAASSGASALDAKQIIKLALDVSTSLP